ncbi:MAG: POTRA domain-containing protein, partial [Elusimicrobiota bacterium]
MNQQPLLGFLLLFAVLTPNALAQPAEDENPLTPTTETQGHDQSVLNALREISRTGEVPEPPKRPEPPAPPTAAPVSISSTVIQAQLDAEAALLNPILISTGVFISTGPNAPPRPVYAIAVSSPAAPAPSKTPTTLAQIQIFGLEKILESQVRRMLNAREWESYSAKDEAEDLAALESSGWFSRVSLRKVILSSATARLDVHLREAESPTIRPTGAPAPKPALDIIKAAAVLGAAEPDIPLPPWVLGEIDIQGNKNVKRSVIRRQIQGRKGDLYGRADHDRDLQRILNLGNFERVVTDIEVLRGERVPAHFEQASKSEHPIKLTFLVEEKPIVNKILYAGRKRISKSRLRDELSMVKRDPFDRTKMREDSEKILELYHKKGFHRARVEPEVKIDTETFKATITYRLEEGPRSRIKAVRFTGVTLFKKKSPEKASRKLARKARMKNRRKKRYAAKQLQADLKAIEIYYKNRGHLDYELKDSSVTFSPDGKEIFIDIDIHEGRAYRYGETTFSGQMIYTSTDLAKAIDYRRGKVFNQERFDRTMQGLRELSAEKGRLRAQIAPTKTFNEKSDLMDVHFALRENDPVYIDHIDIEGNKATKTYVFMRELAVKPG